MQDVICQAIREKRLSKRFAPRPEYQRSDGAIARVFCQV
jgi:hypothetical protein